MLVKIHPWSGYLDPAEQLERKQERHVEPVLVLVRPKPDIYYTMYRWWRVRRLMRERA